jgi:hypothetical protein
MRSEFDTRDIVFAAKILLANIRGKTHQLLLEDTASAARKEKSAQLLLIAHLGEVAHRRLYLDKGYGSMFAYCQHLGLADTEIWLRLQVSSCCHRVPELFEELAVGSISLTVAGKVSAHLNDTNKASILSCCRGKTVREVEEYLASLRPKPVLPESLRPKPVLPESLRLVRTAQQNTEPNPSTSKMPPQEEGIRLSNEQELFSSLSSATVQENSPEKSHLELLGNGRYHLRFAFTAAQLRKLERLADLVGEANPRKNLATMMEKALDIALQVKDPARPRRAKKAAAAPAPAPASAARASADPASAASEWEAPIASQKSRVIPSATKRLVFARGNYRCQFTAADGTRCAERRHLCIDHVYPFAKGGSNHADNLQLLCWMHNHRKIEIDFGFRWQPRGMHTTRSFDHKKT